LLLSFVFPIRFDSRQNFAAGQRKLIALAQFHTADMLQALTHRGTKTAVIGEWRLANSD
jgi:hypothetical protein